jgi:phosphatidylglycerol:prolipoprotein diacylglycerol transferase
MNPIAFRIFGQPIYWYGILISIGVLLGIVLALRNAKYFDIDQDSIIDMALLAIPLAIVGARLYYVIFEWEQYRDNIWSIFNIRKGGLAIFGGVIGGALGVIIYSRRKKLSFWDLADICAPSLILGQAIGRWGNYINQEAYGFAVNNPEWQWFPAAVYIDATQQWHLATFFYESFWNFIVFIIKGDAELGFKLIAMIIYESIVPYY